jgi:hypothetical protein
MIENKNEETLRDVVRSLPTASKRHHAAATEKLGLYSGAYALPDIYAPEYADIVNENLTERQPEKIDAEICTPKAPDESKLVKVRSNLKAKEDAFRHLAYPTAIFERNEAHPNDEIFIADNETHLVALTKAVCDALLESRLVIIKE